MNQQSQTRRNHPKRRHQPGPRGTNEPRARVYELTGAINRLCLACYAEPGHWCTDQQGAHKRIPHVDRCHD